MIYIKCIYTFDEKENYDRTDSLRMLVNLVMMAMMAIMAMMSMMAMKTKTMMVMMLKTMMVMMLMVSQIALVSPLEWCHCQCCSVPTLLRFIVPRCTTSYIAPHCTWYHIVYGTTSYSTLYHIDNAVLQYCRSHTVNPYTHSVGSIAPHCTVPC